MCNKTGRPRKIDHKAVIETFAKTQDYKITADKHGISVASVYKILNKNNLFKPKEPYTNVVRRKANELIDYIMINGGTIPETIRKLGVKISHIIVCKEAKKRGIRLLDYKHMSKKIGCWIVTKPGFSRRGGPKGEYFIPVTCKNCGHEHHIREGVISGRVSTPPPCPNCGCGKDADRRIAKNRKDKNRRRIDTQEVVSLYKTLGSKAAVARELEIDITSVYRHLIAAGFHTVKTKDQQLYN